MRGNTYISLNTATWNAKIPTELENRYGWQECDDEGNCTDIVPTWEQLANSSKHKSLYGAPIKIKVGGRNLYIVELTASWLAHEMSAIMALGAGLNAHQNTLMTAEEAQYLISNNTPLAQ